MEKDKEQGSLPNNASSSSLNSTGESFSTGSETPPVMSDQCQDLMISAAAFDALISRLNEHHSKIDSLLETSGEEALKNLKLQMAKDIQEASDTLRKGVGEALDKREEQIQEALYRLKTAVKQQENSFESVSFSLLNAAAQQVPVPHATPVPQRQATPDSSSSVTLPDGLLIGGLIGAIATDTSIGSTLSLVCIFSGLYTGIQRTIQGERSLLSPLYQLFVKPIHPRTNPEPEQGQGPSSGPGLRLS